MVGLYRENGIAMLQKKFGQHPGSGADVGDDGSGSEAALLLEQIDHGGGIARTKLAIGVNATAESLL